MNALTSGIPCLYVRSSTLMNFCQSSSVGTFRLIRSPSTVLAKSAASSAKRPDGAMPSHISSLNSRCIPVVASLPRMTIFEPLRASSKILRSIVFPPMRPRSFLNCLKLNCLIPPADSPSALLNAFLMCNSTPSANA